GGSPAKTPPRGRAHQKRLPSNRCPFATPGNQLAALASYQGGVVVREEVGDGTDRSTASRGGFGSSARGRCDRRTRRGPRYGHVADDLFREQRRRVLDAPERLHGIVRLSGGCPDDD